MAEGQSIYFDSTYTLRVVEEDKFKDTERLHEECTGFTESELQAFLSPNIARFSATVFCTCQHACEGVSCTGSRCTHACRACTVACPMPHRIRHRGCATGAPAPRVAIDGGRRRGSRRSPWSCLHPALVGRRPQLSPQGRAHAAGWRRLESRVCVRVARGQARGCSCGGDRRRIPRRPLSRQQTCC
jgi:hypothetical protein